MSNNCMPQIIHCCWFGENPLPELAQKSIGCRKKYCPDYEIKRWDEADSDLNYLFAGLVPYVWTIRKVMTRALTDYPVKRVSRELNDPKRSYIRGQCGHYFGEVHSILPDARRVPVAAVYGYSVFLFLNNWARKLKRWIFRQKSLYKDNVKAWSRWRRAIEHHRLTM